MLKGYVIYQGRRYRVIGRIDGVAGIARPHLRIRPFKGCDVMAPEEECKPWKRGTVRHLKGTKPHREKRPVLLDIDTGAETIQARLKGKRKRLSCTFGGLYDLLARQAAFLAARDRAHARRLKGRR